MTLAIQSWIKKKGFKFISSPGLTDAVMFGVDCVFINSQPCRDSKIATMLHECGHILIREARQRADEAGSITPVVGVTQREFESGTGRYTHKSKRKSVAVVTEEIEAWERGWNLGRRLKVRMSRKKYENTRIKALMTYMRWCGASKPRMRTRTQRKRTATRKQ